MTNVVETLVFVSMDILTGWHMIYEIIYVQVKFARYAVCDNKGYTYRQDGVNVWGNLSSMGDVLNQLGKINGEELNVRKNVSSMGVIMNQLGKISGKELNV